MPYSVLCSRHNSTMEHSAGQDEKLLDRSPAPSTFVGSIFVAPEIYASVTTAFFMFAPLMCR